MNASTRPTRFWTLTVLAGAAVLTYLFATAPARSTRARMRASPCPPRKP